MNTPFVIGDIRKVQRAYYEGLPVVTFRRKLDRTVYRVQNLQRIPAEKIDQLTGVTLARIASYPGVQS